MKKLILAAIALAIISVSPASAKGFYVTTFGGVNFNDVSYDSKWLQVDSNTGYVIGAALGTTVDQVPGLRAEAELSYRSNGVDITICGDGLKANDETWALMANAVYDVPTASWPVHPYLLAGAGYASRTGSLNNYPLEVSNQGLAYQVGGGVTFKIADGIDGDIGYRYFQGPDLNVSPVDGSGANQSVMAGVRLAF